MRERSPKTNLAYDANKEIFDRHAKRYGSIKFVNPEFGELFSSHLLELSMSRDEISEYLSLCLPIGKLSVYSDLRWYKGGNLLGDAHHLTRRGIINFGRHIGKLIHILNTLDVKSNSRMLDIVREETKLEFTYPPKGDYPLLN